MFSQFFFEKTIVSMSTKSKSHVYMTFLYAWELVFTQKVNDSASAKGFCPD